MEFLKKTDNLRYGAKEKVSKKGSCKSANNRTTLKSARAQFTAPLTPSGSWIAPPMTLVYKDTESNSHIRSTFLAAAPFRQPLQLGTRSIGVWANKDPNAALIAETEDYKDSGHAWAGPWDTGRATLILGTVYLLFSRGLTSVRPLTSHNSQQLLQEECEKLQDSLAKFHAYSLEGLTSKSAALGNVCCSHR